MKKWIRRFVLLFLGLVLGTGIYMICAERISKDPFPMPFGIGVAVSYRITCNNGNQRPLINP